MKINLRATFANLEEIMAAGGQEVLDKLYSGLVTSAGDGSVVLDVDTSGTLPCSKGMVANSALVVFVPGCVLYASRAHCVICAEELVGRLACLGRNLVGAPILLYVAWLLVAVRVWLWLWLCGCGCVAVVVWLWLCGCVCVRACVCDAHGGAWSSALDALKESNLAVTAPKKITISSSGQCMYVATKADRVAATYCLRFGDEADVALAKVVLQQMAETSGLNAHYSATCDIPGAPASNVGYLSLSVASMKATKSPDSCLTQLVYFPHYLDYHVKAAKVRSRAAS